MVDCKSYAKMIPQVGLNPVFENPPGNLILDDVPRDEFHFCVPTVCGYSFRAKKWGRFVVNKLTDVRWHKTAFDDLVLSTEKKSLIQRIILGGRHTTDVMLSKFDGFIVLLYGKPATGKRLTAEVAAEMAQKPLLVVSPGDFGGDPFNVEFHLGNVLEICKKWNAILLIDEPEVYLEPKPTATVERPAIVSAFLRAIQYHQQVIFLTTNNISRLDASIISRVSVAIKYSDPDQSAREEIWTKLLKMASVKICETKSQIDDSLTKAEVTELARKNMNGQYSFFVYLYLILDKLKMPFTWPRRWLPLQTNP